MPNKRDNFISNVAIVSMSNSHENKSLYRLIYDNKLKTVLKESKVRPPLRVQKEK